MFMYLYRECFVACEEMHVVKQFKAAINRRFNENCGVFWHNLSDSQLIDYTWSKVREFFANSGKTLVGTLSTGRQPNLKKLDERGNLVDVEESELRTLQSLKDLVDDFDEAVYIINEKLQVKENRKYICICLYVVLVFTQ